MTHASIFSGIGGPEVAAAMLGWQNLFHCEINPFCRAVLEYWFPNSKSYEDITKTDFTEWRGKVDVLTGGFPCQPFSYAGQRRGADDDRYLWPEFKRVIAEVRPTWVIGENVAGIVSMVEPGKVSPMASQASLFDEGDGVQRYRREQPFTIERVCTDLEGLGYAVQPILIPACAVGAPHRRDRVFIIAHAENALHGGQLHRPNEEQGRERHIGDTGTGSGEWLCGETSRASANPKCLRLQHDLDGRSETGVFGTEGEGGQDCLSRQIQSSETDGRGGAFANTVRLETERRDAADTENDGSRGEARSAGESSERPHGQSDEQHSVGYCFWHVGPDDPRFAENGIAGQERWQDFPSVSPVHAGNDGIPFRMDRAAIPFGKWRTEALKAYGNAIVVQVMYEIFRAIIPSDRNCRTRKKYRAKKGNYFVKKCSTK